MIAPTSDSGHLEVSTPEQSNRGWHNYERRFVFPLIAADEEVSAFALGMKTAEGHHYMWFGWNITRAEMIGVVLKLSYGFDSGD